MLTPRRTLAALIAVLVVLAVVFYDHKYWLSALEIREASSVSACRFDMDSTYYVLDSNWADHNKYSQYISNHAGQLPIKADDVKDRIAQKVAEVGGDAFKAVEKDVREKYQEEYTEEFRKIIEADLRSDMTRDYTDFFFMELVKSYKVLEDLKAFYLENNAARIRNGLVHDLLADTTDTKLKAKVDALERLQVDSSQYFRSVARTIIRHAPRLPELTHLGEKIGGNMHREVSRMYSRDFLTQDRVKLSQAEFDELKETHNGISQALRNMFVPPVEVYSGDGIVISTTREHLAAALGVVIQLRELGSELPVEVIFDTEQDYNKEACEELLPRLQASCKVIERELSRELLDKLHLERFQMKVMAIMVSSFDNTLVLDSDNWPIKKPDFLFSSEPFLETKYVLWPDAWHKGTSPLYYDLAGFNVGEPVRRDGLANDKKFSDYTSKNVNKDVLFHDLDGIPPFRSVESGQLLLSKREHFRSLFLSVYYNVYGPGYYYPLLYQGTFGTGDRETYIPALHVMKEPYYFCDHEMTFIGVQRKFEIKEGTFMDESTMVQRDPQHSRRYMRAWRRFLREKKLDTRLNPFQEGSYTDNLRAEFLEKNSDVVVPEAIFLHVHDPKLSALHNELSRKTRFDYKTRYMREIGKFDDVIGTTDWELRFQTINMWVTCHGLKDPELWKSFEIDRAETCNKMKEYVELLKADSNDVKASDVKMFDILTI